MNILIGNHIDPAIRDRGNLRAWTQRVFWFAREGDVVILSHRPDLRFVRHVVGLTGADMNSLHVIIAPEGVHGGHLMDPGSLADPRLHASVRATANLNDVESIFALWPSESVARFASALGIHDRMPGAAFFAQRGGELCNSKAVFRAIAASAGVPTPHGYVCHSLDEAVTASSELLAQTGAIMVKQAHNGAGMGNQLVHSESIAIDHVGARHLHLITAPNAASITRYWRERWAWASAEGRFPVVIEEFVTDADTVYSEHFAGDGGTRCTEMGSLHYVGRRLSHQIVPLRDVDPQVRQQLLDGATLLAEAYQRFGYRGYLSADAVVTPDAKVLFTEVNAQVSGSLHIYQAIAHGVVGVDDLPHRSVIEYHVPPTWAVPDWQTFMATVQEQGCAYDRATRAGVIVSMPIEPLVEGMAQFVFCIAYATEQDRDSVMARLDRQFSSVPPGTYDASERVGVPTAMSVHANVQ